MRDLTPDEILHADNCHIQKLFQSYNSETNSVKKRAILHNILNNLETHMLVEEYILYPKIEDISLYGMQLVDQGRREHETMKEMHDLLRSMSVQDEQCDLTLSQLQTIVDRHIRDEESSLFPLAKKSISEVCSLGLAAKIFALKERIKLRARSFNPVREI